MLFCSAIYNLFKSNGFAAFTDNLSLLLANRAETFSFNVSMKNVI